MTATTTAATKVNVAETSAQITALEGALAQVPAGAMFENTRTVMQGQIALLKASISKSKPIGLRLESCRAAVARAAKRKEEAEAAVVAAVFAESKATAEHAQYVNDLAELERELSSSVGASVQPADCVQNMASALQRVVGEMKSSPLVPLELVKQAEQQMETLLSGVKQISALATQAAQAQVAQPPKVSAPHVRLSRKTGHKRASSADYHPTEHRRKTGKLHPVGPLPQIPVPGKQGFREAVTTQVAA